MFFNIPTNFVTFYHCASRELFLPFDNIYINWDSKEKTAINLKENGYIEYISKRIDFYDEYRRWEQKPSPVFSSLIVDDSEGRGKVERIHISMLSFDIEKTNKIFNYLKGKYDLVKINGEPQKREKKGVNSFNVKMFITEDDIFKSQRFEMIITKHKRMYR